ncbi:MAG: metalloregulator ArsR/SmtB family transcription factor [Chloroflexi bacterium]|nr:metalloregulator ArsR/SmtB family transcription factor [Chloroflexota bacterium]
MSSVSESEVMQLHAEICAGLADPKRIMILYELVPGPRNVNDIAAALGAPQPQISRHLKVLRERGMVIAERHGATVAYTVADARIIQALDLLRQVLADKLRNQAALAATAASASE